MAAAKRSTATGIATAGRGRAKPACRQGAGMVRAVDRAAAAETMPKGRSAAARQPLTNAARERVQDMDMAVGTHKTVDRVTVEADMAAGKGGGVM